MLVKFITSGANSAFGGFESGDILRCSEAMAKHLVEEIKCAKYMDVPVQEAPAEDAPVQEAEIEQPKRGRKPKGK